MSPGIVFRKLRLNHNYSQQYVANCLNISRNAYMDWESDKINISLKQCMQICELYNLRLSKLIEDYIENHPISPAKLP